MAEQDKQAQLEVLQPPAAGRPVAPIILPPAWPPSGTPTPAQPGQIETEAPITGEGPTALLRPPLGSPGGTTKIPQSSLARPTDQYGVAVYPGGAAQVLIPYPVLARNARGVAWALPLVLPTTAKVLTLRIDYRDLHIEPGFRGLLLQYSSAQTTGVKVAMNFVGMTLQLPNGAQTVFVPLFMSREMVDLTITGSANFVITDTALLTTEEQVPFTTT
jgi:hypothetical protein